MFGDGSRRNLVTATERGESESFRKSGGRMNGVDPKNAD